MNIYRASVEDIEHLAPLFDLYRQFYEQESDLASAKAYLSARLENCESVIFAAEIGSGLSGFVQLYPAFSSISMKKTWILNDLYVDSAFRKQGVGEQLLQKAREFALETGAAGISLSTAADNHSAQRLYDKSGYVRDRRFLHYDLIL